MTERGKRFNEGKRRWSLIDHRVLEPLVDVMEVGEKKYGHLNYQKGMPIVEIMDSLQRHLVEFRDHGNDLDEESKMHHGAHILSNAYILMYNILFHPDMDNRVKADIHSDESVNRVKAWAVKSKIPNLSEWVNSEWPELIKARGQAYVDEVFKEDSKPTKRVEYWGSIVKADASNANGGILKGIGPEDFLRKEGLNARVRRNS